MNSKPESVGQTPRFHRPHPSIFSITRSHRQLIKAVKIWKMPFLSSSNFTAGALKPRSFKERLRCVEMHRKASEVSTAPKSIACSIRDMQLCSSDSSPSPFNSPLESQDTRRRRPVHTRHYRKQLQWYHTLSRNKRPKQHKPHHLNLEGQRSQTALSVTGSSSQRKRCQRSSPSAESPPEFQTPARKTSRRLWRRQLDSSSSESSRSTRTTPADVKNRHQTPNTHKPRDNTNSLKSKTSWTEFNFLDIHSDSITEASPAHKTQKNRSVTSKKDKRKDSPATKPNVQTSDVTDEKIKSLQKTQNSINEKMTFHRQQKVKKTSEPSSGPHTTVPSQNQKKNSKEEQQEQTDDRSQDIRHRNKQTTSHQDCFIQNKTEDSDQIIPAPSRTPGALRPKLSSGQSRETHTCCVCDE